jgi:transcriptional regulator
MLHSYNSEETRQRAETIYKLRLHGYSFVQIAKHVGTSYTNASVIFKKECKLRKLAFDGPFVEWLSSRAANAIRRALGEEIFAAPEELRETANVKKLLLFPGVSDGVMIELANALTEAGYEPFDLEEIKATMYGNKRRLRNLDN